MVVRSVKIFIQLDDETLEERGKFSFGLVHIMNFGNLRKNKNKGAQGYLKNLQIFNFRSKTNISF